MTRGTLVFVAGAPGSGKTTVVARLVVRAAPCVFFDMDALVGPASALAGRDVRTTPATWLPYNALWLSVLCAICENGLTPVLFTPADPDDFERQPLPEGCKGMSWLLLDCDDEVRRERLSGRGWGEARVQEALEDAATMRQQIPQRLDTTVLSPDEVADRILGWLELDQQKG